MTRKLPYTYVLDLACDYDVYKPGTEVDIQTYKFKQFADGVRPTFLFTPSFSGHAITL